MKCKNIRRTYHAGAKDALLSYRPIDSYAWPIVSHSNISFLLPFVFLPCHVMSCIPRPAGLVVSFFNAHFQNCATAQYLHPLVVFQFSTTFHSSSYSNLLQLGKSRGSHSYIYLHHDLFKKKMNELYHFVYLYSLLLYLPFCLLRKHIRVGSFSCHPYSFHALITACFYYGVSC